MSRSSRRSTWMRSALINSPPELLVTSASGDRVKPQLGQCAQSAIYSLMGNRSVWFASVFTKLFRP
jgi:hypothetical protein